MVAASAWGLAIAAFGFADARPALALLAVAGAADQVSAIFRSTIMLTVTADHLRGRVACIEFAQVAATPALGNLEAGAGVAHEPACLDCSGGIASVVELISSRSPSRRLLRYDSRHPRRA